MVECMFECKVRQQCPSWIDTRGYDDDEYV